MSYDEGDFRAFLGGTINENLSKHFSEYKKAFLESSELANLQKSKIYKDSNNKDSLQEAEFVNFALKKEKEKILYFSLSYQNEVLIIKSPNDNKEQKKFLGYEWSNRKGDEGLKELNIPYTTPLFERENPNNPHKINTLIKNAFLAKSKNLTNEPLPKSLPQGEGLSHSPTFARGDSESSSLAEGALGWVENLTALLKSLPTPPKNGWERVNVDNVLSLEYGKALQEAKRIEGEYPVMGSNGIVGYHNEYIVQAPNIIVGRKGSAGKITFIEKNCYPIDTTFYVQLKAQYNVKLLYYVLKLLNLEKDKGGTGAPGINRNDIFILRILNHKNSVKSASKMFDFLEIDTKFDTKAMPNIKRLRKKLE